LLFCFFSTIDVALVLGQNFLLYVEICGGVIIKSLINLDLWIYLTTYQTISIEVNWLVRFIIYVWNYVGYRLSVFLVVFFFLWNLCIHLFSKSFKFNFYSPFHIFYLNHLSRWPYIGFHKVIIVLMMGQSKRFIIPKEPFCYIKLYNKNPTNVYNRCH
jgi:hypothetical protein